MWLSLVACLMFLLVSAAPEYGGQPGAAWRREALREGRAITAAANRFLNACLAHYPQPTQARAATRSPSFAGSGASSSVRQDRSLLVAEPQKGGPSTNPHPRTQLES